MGQFCFKIHTSMKGLKRDTRKIIGELKKTAIDA